MTSDALTVTIKPLNENDPTALHRHYPNELNAQPCHLELDLRDGELTADYNPEIGNSVPSTVWHGIVRRWGIPCITATAANQLMHDLAPLAQRILDGASVEWDGNNNVGRLTDDAAQAEQELVDFLAEATDLEQVYEQDAADWWSEGELPDDLTAHTADDQLAAIAEREAAEVATSQDDAYTVLVGAEEYLAGRREEMRDAVREELEEVAAEHARLEQRRNDLIRALSGWGDSSRSIADRVGLSHVAVQKIAKREPEAAQPSA